MFTPVVGQPLFLALNRLLHELSVSILTLKALVEILMIMLRNLVATALPETHIMRHMSFTP